jgi:hypothetical protein
MFNSSFHFECRNYIVAMLILTLSLSSCKKTAPVPEPDDDRQTTSQVTNLDPSSGTKQFDLVPIQIELPDALFEGTPPNLKGVENLEKETNKARPPFYAPQGTVNVAFQKPVSASDEEPVMGDIAMITDGDKKGSDGSYVELGPFLQYVQVDLEAVHEIYAVLLWHYHKKATVYYDVVVQISNDPDFITDVKTVFNNDIDNSAGRGVGKDMHYIDKAQGKLIDAKGIKARYVRMYSNGNSANDLNHYIEVEVFGRPAE